MSLSLHWIDLSIIGVYFVVVLGMGLWLARQEKGSASDFFVAGRKLGWLVVGASLFASNISSEHLIGLSADGFRSGLAVGNYEWGACVVLVILATVFVPFYIGSRIQTMPEFLERRFGRGARVYLSLVTIAANVLVRISVALYAGALVMQEMFGLGIWTSIAILALTTVLYTAAGGLKAVVYTDAVQAAVLLAGTAFLSAIALHKVGGWSGLTAALDPEMFDMVRPASDPEMPWPGLLLGVPILGIWYWCTDQVIVQRVLGSRDVHNARMGALFAAFLKILPVFLFVLPGLCGRVLFPEIESKTVFPVMVRELLPVGVTGLVAAALIAALMSSIDSTLNSTGTLVSLDFYQPRRPDATQAELVRVGRITTVVVMVFGVLWVLVVRRAESIFQYLQQVQAAISPPIAASFLLGVFWPRANHAGVLSSLLGGLCVGLGLLAWEPLPFLMAAGVTFAFSIIVLVAVSLATEPPKPEQVEGLCWKGIRPLLEKATTSRQRLLFRVLVAAILACMAVLWLRFSGAWPWAPGGVARPDAAAQSRAPRADEETLAFRITHGSIDNHFYRRGRVAAHLLTTSGTEPRLIVAFPAGNSGVGLWFEKLGEPAELSVEGELSGVEGPNGMRGVSATIAVSAPRLRVRRAVLGSVRLLRDYMNTGEVPGEVAHMVGRGPPLVFRRADLAGRHGYSLGIEALDGGRTEEGREGKIAIEAPPEGGALRFRITALTDEPPLTPIASTELLKSDEGADPGSLKALAFLCYREKLLAGSWRFLTYFGRDTLLSLRLLLPNLRPAAIEAGLGAVLDRLDPEGRVAHEEDIGDWAALRNSNSEDPPSDPRAPLHDYRMIDDDFLLAPVAAAYLLDSAEGNARAPAFLSRLAPSGVTYRDALRRNMAYVLKRAEPFARDPGPATLIALAPGRDAGNWRDSRLGLGLGRIPFDVNAAFVPAALEASARLIETGLFGRKAAAAEARRLARAWDRAREYFLVNIPAAHAREWLGDYAAELGLDFALAETAEETVFSAVALHEDGQPVPVMSSDEGFMLLFRDPPAEYLEQAAERVIRPFPGGLRTPAGLVAANPGFSSGDSLRRSFTRGHYHGAVIWSWQQAVWAAGLRRQLERKDLPSSTRNALKRAQALLWEAIDGTEPLRSSELWSWTVEDGRVKHAPFGELAERMAASPRNSGLRIDIMEDGRAKSVSFADIVGHRTEANAVQLWSTVYLGIPRPASPR
ncbi:MAG: sodium:solute symporter [Elusimicrobiota bacterium]